MSASLKERLAELEAENAKLREDKEKQSVIRFKVGDKGGLSMYGLGRFPVTLYLEQWERLLASVDMIRQALADNKAKLKRKE